MTKNSKYLAIEECVLKILVDNDDDKGGVLQEDLWKKYKICDRRMLSRIICGMEKDGKIRRYKRKYSYLVMLSEEKNVFLRKEKIKELKNKFASYLLGFILERGFLSVKKYKMDLFRRSEKICTNKKRICRSIVKKIEENTNPDSIFNADNVEFLRSYTNCDIPMNGKNWKNEKKIKLENIVLVDDEDMNSVESRKE